MNKGFMLSSLMVYVLVSTILCGVIFRSITYILSTYQRLNAQASLVRSMIVGCSLLNTFAVSIDNPLVHDTTLSWQNNKVTHAFVLNNKIIWYTQTADGQTQRRIALMHYVNQLNIKPTSNGLLYQVEFKLDDQMLRTQILL